MNLKSPVVILQDKAKRVGIFHILEDKHTLVAGFKARLRINILACPLWNKREGKLSFLAQVDLLNIFGKTYSQYNIQIYLNRISCSKLRGCLKIQTIYTIG